MPEQRKVERIAMEKLPESLKVFEISFGLFDHVQAITYNASTTGLGLTVESYFDKFQLNDHIILNALAADFKIIGEIIYLNQKSDNKMRIGLQIKKSKSLKAYQEQLEKHISD